MKNRAFKILEVIPNDHKNTHKIRRVQKIFNMETNFTKSSILWNIFEYNKTD